MTIRSLILVGLCTVFLGACASTPPIPPTAEKYSTPLERAVMNRNLHEGWNDVVIVAGTGERISCHVSGGIIDAWEVREADGTLVPSEIRPIAPYNDSVKRLWWQPTVGSSRFVEAPNWILTPTQPIPNRLGSTDEY